jgi:membrane protein
MSSHDVSRGAVLRKAFANFREHQMTDHAASLTYYAMMSLFPALLVGVTLLGLFGQEGLVTDATNYLLDHGADKDTAAVVGRALGRIINSSGGALGVTLIISVLLGLNGASGAFGAAGRALNVVFETTDERSFVTRKLTDLGVTLLVMALLLVVLVSLFLGGQIADDLLGRIGLGSTGAAIWRWVRWPIALLAAMVAFGLVLRLSPAGPARERHWLSLGAVFGVVLWIALSVGFALYIRGFSTYGAAYGAFGAAIVLLLWLYLSANAFLFGAELNAEARRTGLTKGDAPPPPAPPGSPAPRPAHDR